jgi:hypothetical protein
MMQRGRLWLLLGACGRASSVSSVCRMGLESFKLADLSGNGAKAEQFRAALKRDHVAIVELPSCHRPAIANMWSYAEDFFHLPKSTRETMGPLFEPEYSERHLGQGRLTGFTQKAFNDCLDTRLRRCSSSSGAAMRGDLEILPRELEESLPGATQAMLEAQRVLFDLGLSALRIVCEELNADPLLGMPVTPEGICSSSEDLSEGATSATVHRLVRYAAAGGLQGIQRVIGRLRPGWRILHERCGRRPIHPQGRPRLPCSHGRHVVYHHPLRRAAWA